MSLFFRNLFFVLLQPGIVAILIPYWLSGRSLNAIVPPTISWQNILGFLVFSLGTVIMLICVASFALRGKGTLSPADPTRKLVISGLYKYSRNPMYVGVSLMIIGQSIYFQSYIIAGYAFIIFIAFNTFIIFFEEPRLLDAFGSEYEEYLKKVRRWF